MDRSHEDRKWDRTKYIGKWKGLRQFVEQQSKVETPLSPVASIDREQEPSSAPECQAYYIGSNFPLEQPPPGLPPVVLWSPPETSPFGESQADDVDAEQLEQLTLEFHGSEATSQPTSTPAVSNQQENAGFNDITIGPPGGLKTDSGLEEDNGLHIKKPLPTTTQASGPPLPDFVPDPTTEPVAHCTSSTPPWSDLKRKGILRKTNALVSFKQFHSLAPEFGTSKQISPPLFENSSIGSQPQSAGARAVKKVRFA